MDKTDIFVKSAKGEQKFRHVLTNCDQAPFGAYHDRWNYERADIAFQNLGDD